MKTFGQLVLAFLAFLAVLVIGGRSLGPLEVSILLVLLGISVALILAKPRWRMSRFRRGGH